MPNIYIHPNHNRALLPLPPLLLLLPRRQHQQSLPRILGFLAHGTYAEAYVPVVGGVVAEVEILDRAGEAHEEFVRACVWGG